MNAVRFEFGVRQRTPVDALVMAARDILRVAETAFLPGPVYLSAAEVKALRAAVDAVEQAK